jgi:hypothetical protein
LTFIVVACPSEQTHPFTVEEVKTFPMIGDVNLFLKGTLPWCEERIDDEEFEAEVEIMIAGVSPPQLFVFFC